MSVATGPLEREVQLPFHDTKRFTPESTEQAIGCAAG